MQVSFTPAQRKSLELICIQRHILENHRIRSAEDYETEIILISSTNSKYLNFNFI
jgi:hypothetical protein